MKVTTKFFVVALILSLIFAVSAVAAAEDISFDQSDLKANDDELTLSVEENNQDPLMESDNHETISAPTDSEKLTAGQGTYSDLRNEIDNGGDKNLTKSYYSYVSGDGRTIEISKSGVIDGNGAVIDMNGFNLRAFYVSVSGVTFKNLTIKNANYAEDGGAIYFDGSGTIENCNFTDNTANRGGAVFFYEQGTVTNCNFADNKATGDYSYGGAVYFNRRGDVTNCNFTNNAAYYGGAVFFNEQGNVTNCNFTNNAAYYGGAVFFIEQGNVTNCNFTNNNATGDYSCGGAVYFRNTGNVTNCNFTDNTATNRGGAVYFSRSGTVTNCNFADNSASRGDAIFSNQQYTTADTCIFKTLTGTTNVNTVIRSPTLNVDNFTTFYGSGEKITFDLKTNSSIPVTNGNISISMYFKSNDNWVRNYTCLSGEGWIPDLPVGSYYAIFNTEYAGFQPINRTIEIAIPKIKYYINVTSLTTNNKTVNITAKSDIPKDILWDGKLLFILPNGTQINASYADDGIWWAVHEFANAGDYNITASYAGLDNVVINNATISIRYDARVDVENNTLNLVVGDNFPICASTYPGGLNVTYVVGDFGVCSVDENGVVTALKEGNTIITVKVGGDGKYAENSTIVNVTVTKNPTKITVLNNTLVLNVTNNITAGATLTPPEAGNLTYTSNDTSVANVKDGVIFAVGEGTAVITVSFKGGDVYAPAGNKTITVTVKRIDTNITVVNATVNLFVKESVYSGATLTPPEAGNLTYTSNDTSVAIVKDGNIFAVGEGTAIITVSFNGNEAYAPCENKTITVNVIKYESKVIILPIADVVYPNNAVIRYSVENRTNITVSIPGVSNDKIIITNDTITVIGLNAGNYTVTIINSESDIYHASNVSASFTVKRVSVDVVTDGGSKTFDAGENLEFTLKDSNGNPVSGVNTIISINGVDYTCPTDENGIARLPIHLRPKTYTATMTFAGNENYDKMNSTVQVTVKKTTPKIVAKKKTFKAKTKTKKYKITLKNNHNTPISKVKVILKIKGKKYKAKTNSKGKATFKIKKLTRKGKYKAKVTFKGNAFYNKVSKKVKVTVK